MKTRIMLADDHKIIRDGLKKLLNDQSDLEVIAETDNGRSAVKLALEIQPDIIIMDISMPELNGVEATKQILDKLHNTSVIALSMHSDRHFVEKMLKVGALGYVLKDCAFDELIQAIKKVREKQFYLSPSVTSLVLDDYIRLITNATNQPTETKNQTTNITESQSSILSSREKEVLQLLSEGKTTKEISHHLSLSLKTVETHRSNIMKKLNLHSIAELTKYAIKEGLTSL